jgi:hypothetical protein
MDFEDGGSDWCLLLVQSLSRSTTASTDFRECPVFAIALVAIGRHNACLAVGVVRRCLESAVMRSFVRRVHVVGVAAATLSLVAGVLVVPDGVGFAGSSGAVSGVPRASLSAVAAGGAHTCAIVTGGQVSCWGSDFSGQLGNGAATGPVVSPP